MQHAAGSAEQRHGFVQCSQQAVSLLSPKPWQGMTAQRYWWCQEGIFSPCRVVSKDKMAADDLRRKYSKTAYGYDEIKGLLPSAKCYKGHGRARDEMHSDPQQPQSFAPNLNFALKTCSCVCQSNDTSVDVSYATAPQRCRHKRWKMWHGMKC